VLVRQPTNAAGRPEHGQAMMDSANMMQTQGQTMMDTGSSMMTSGQSMMGGSGTPNP